MNQSKYQVLLKTIECKSFSKAGQALNYTASGINRTISALEEELGCSLVIRTKKGVKLSEEGTILLPYINNVLAAEKALEECTKDINGLQVGNINIGTIYCIANSWLPEIISSFKKSYPKITLDIMQGSHLELDTWLESGKADLIFTTKRENDDNWIPLIKDPYVVWVSTNNPLSGEETFDQKNFKTEDFIINIPGQNSDADYLIKKRKINVNAKYTSKDNYATYKMVEAGLGISLNNQLMDKGWNGNVKALPLNPPAYIELGIRTPRHISPAASKFIEVAKNTIK